MHSYDTIGQRCGKCKLATFQAEAKLARNCPKCQEGSLTLYGDSKCVKCADQDFLTIGENCKTRPAGKELIIYSSGDDKCQECGMVFFKPFIGKGKCQKCSDGLFSLHGAFKCVSCRKGKALNKIRTCQLCPPGFG